MEKKEPISFSFHPITNQKEFDQNFKRLREKSSNFKKSINQSHNISDNELNIRFTI